MNSIRSTRNASKLFVIALGLLGSIAVRADGPRVKKQDPAVYFWYHFRTAVLQNQFQKIDSVTRFPFELTEGGGVTIRLSKSAFREKVLAILDRPLGSGGSMRALIEKKEDLSPEDRTALLAGDWTYGTFRFKTIKEKCYWVGTAESAEGISAVSAPPPQRTEGPAAVPARNAKGVPEEAGPSNPATAPSALKKQGDPTPVSGPVDPRTESLFRFYWVEFRRAALSNDFEKLRRLTRFPFETKGPLEDDKVKKYPAREFDLVWPHLLEADPKSWGPIRDSMRELIERREEPSVEEMATEPAGEIKIGVFVFRKSKNRWRFTRAIVL